MRLDHIGIAVTELDAANELIARLLGRSHYKVEAVADQGVNTSFFVAEGAQAKLELVAGTTEGNPIDKFIGKRQFLVRRIASKYQQKSLANGIVKDRFVR